MPTILTDYLDNILKANVSWGIEDETGAEMTANEADELSWKLREQGKSPRINP